jgi:hypothetical protein
LGDLRFKVEEWMCVLNSSKRTQACLILAVVSPLAFLLVGEYSTAKIYFTPPFEALLGPVRESILHRNGEAAITTFLGFMGAAVADFRRTRRELLWPLKAQVEALGRQRIGP